MSASPGSAIRNEEQPAVQAEMEADQSHELGTESGTLREDRPIEGDEPTLDAEAAKVVEPVTIAEEPTVAEPAMDIDSSNDVEPSSDVRPIEQTEPTREDNPQSPQSFPLGSILNLSSSTLETDSEYAEGASPLAVDSALGSVRGSTSSRSITESVIDYRFENGRRYHSARAGDYYLPNDETEQDRLDLQHHIFKIALDGRSYISPLAKEDIHDVLDIGCGTGIWCIEVADELPHARVEGIDLSPIQPTMVPPNCSFYVDDCNEEWERDQKYDLIHLSAMILGVTDWPKLFRQAYETLTPGGYLELREYEGTVTCRNKPDPPDPYLCQFTTYVNEAFTKMGRNLGAAKLFKSMLLDAGFVDVNVVHLDCPVGTWAKGRKNKEMGLLMVENFTDAAQNCGAVFTRVLGWQPEEFQVFAAKILEDTRSGRWHLQARLFFAYGRKPITQ